MAWRLLVLVLRSKALLRAAVHVWLGVGVLINVLRMLLLLLSAGAQHPGHVWCAQGVHHAA
jgi:hypothetical protein